jgi:cytochrome c
MKFPILTLVLGIHSLTATDPVLANPALAQAKNCMGCHHATDRRVGPPFKQIAARYAGQADAPDKLAQKILKGGAGSWGAVPMPENRQVSPAEARQLVQWILAQK